jgi:hypothetical protein
MTWAKTSKKLKKHFTPKRLADDSELEDSQLNKLREDESETEEDSQNPGNKVLYFLDKEYS